MNDEDAHARAFASTDSGVVEQGTCRRRLSRFGTIALARTSQSASPHDAVDAASRRTAPDAAAHRELGVAGVRARDGARRDPDHRRGLGRLRDRLFPFLPREPRAAPGTHLAPGGAGAGFPFGENLFPG